MTKYILHGGDTREINPNNNGFFREMTLGSKDKILVLLNYFAREDNEVEGLAEQDKQRFLQNKDIDILNKLTAYKEKLPLLVLPNYKWVVFYQ